MTRIFVFCCSLALLTAGCGKQPTAAGDASREAAPVAATQPAAVQPAAAPANAPEPPPEPEGLTLPRGTRLHVRLGETVDTRRSRPGERFTATLYEPVRIGGDVVLPRGTPFTGHVTEAKPSGRLRGRAVLRLTLDSFRLGGNTYRIATSGVGRVSAAHKRRNIGFIGGGSGLGAVVGAIAGGGTGALVGAGAGAAAGTVGAAVTGRRNVRLPVESRLTFTLTRPARLSM